MNEQVFGTLTAAGAVRKPSEDLLMRIETLGWRHHGQTNPLVEHPDAHFHETDCLDYCNEYIVQNFSYDVAVPTLPLEPYMREYRAVIRNETARLSENAFERMNDLPAGVMGQLRQFCEVRVDEPPGRNLSEELPNMSRAMCFIFKGAVSLVKIVARRRFWFGSFWNSIIASIFICEYMLPDVTSTCLYDASSDFSC